MGTAAPYDNVVFFYNQLGLSKWFEFEKMVYNDGTIPGKPAPDVYLKAARNLDVS